MDFLKGPKDDGCVFCSLPRQSGDRENLILHRGKLNFVIMNKYPYANGHLMIVPLRHTADFVSMTAEESAEMHDLAQHGVKALAGAYQPGGYNLGMNLGTAGGAGIKDHLHLHVVPRWLGDNNFMPVIADTRAMPQHLMSSYDSLAPYFARLR